MKVKKELTELYSNHVQNNSNCHLVVMNPPEGHLFTLPLALSLVQNANQMQIMMQLCF